MLFPAPFSPSSAWISPAWTSKSTESLASTPGNRLVIPSSRNSGVGVVMVVWPHEPRSNGLVRAEG